MHSLTDCYISFFLYFLIVNRRLDEWVKLEQLDLDSVEAVVDEKVEDKVMICLFKQLLYVKQPFLFLPLYPTLWCIRDGCNKC